MTQTTELPNFTAFEVESRALGYDVVLQRRWDPGTVLDDHSHPFDARALVVEGEMWLKVGSGDTQHLKPGDRFEVGRGAEHTERYGDAGATYWVARRS